MTKYRVLRAIVDEIGAEKSSPGFEIVRGEVEAHGPKAAIRVVAEQEGVTADGETYVAVPESNWTEVPVSFETPKPRLRVGAATPAVANQGSISDALTKLTTEPEA